MASVKGILAGRAFVQLFADDSKLVKGLRRAEKRLKAFGNKVRSVGLKTAALGAAIVAPMAAATKSFMNYGDELGKMSERTGIAAKSLSELQFVASQTGTDFSALESGIRRMQRSIYDAGKGLSTATDALADLGLEFSDLDGLSPEDQFKVLADRIGQIEDPTRKAAIAMSLFGRSGTSLLPMFALGAKGMEKMQKAARDLGLAVEDEDVAAAVKLTDTLDQLWRVIKMGVFIIGASLAPKLQKIAELLVSIASKTIKWINDNRDLVVSIAKVSAIVLGAGIAIALLGLAIHALGTIFGVFATVVHGIWVVFSALSTVVSALLTPLGLLTTAFLLAGVAVLLFTEVGGKALDWLSDRFSVLKEDFNKMIGAMGAALADGNIGLAAQILWKTIKLEFTRGINDVKRVLITFKFGALTIWEQLMARMAQGWVGLIFTLKRSWTEFKSWLEKINKKTENWVTKRAIEFEALFDDSINVDLAKKMADQRLEDATDKIEDERDADIQKLEDQYVDAMLLARRETEKNRRDLDKAAAKEEGKLQDELDDLRRQWLELINRSKKEDGDDGDGDSGLPSLKNLFDLFTNLPVELGKISKPSTTGTFDATFADRLGYGPNVEERIAKATEKTAKNTKETNDKIKDIIVRFG